VGFVLLTRVTVADGTRRSLFGQRLPGVVERRRFQLWAGVALALHVLSALCTAGYYNADEHFQIIEFGSAITGRIPKSELTWEFGRHVRSTLQPHLVALIERGLHWAGADNPFVLATAYRLVFAVAAWASMVLLALAVLPWFARSALRRWLMPVLALTWFVPYLHARTSSENFSETFFLAGLALILLETTPAQLNPARALAVGLLFGVAFEGRFQTGLNIAGVVAWCAIVGRVRPVALAAMAGGIVALIAVGVVLDRQFYGAWVFTPWDYLQVQIFEHKADSFGTSPPWAFFTMVFEQAIPPFSVALIAGTLWAWIKRPRSLECWATAPFFLVHCILGHKELRFLFPIATLALILTLRSWVDWWPAWQRIRPVRALLWCLGAINVALLLAVSSRPVRPVMAILERIYDQSHTPLVVNYAERNPFVPNLELHFYEPPTLTMKRTSYAELSAALASGVQDAWLVEPRFDLPPEAGALMRTCEVNARSLPHWLRRFDFNGWQSRTTVWTLYHCRGVRQGT
jgi:phosphatidylinositol glycan class B